jgi:hypothetical protein
VKKRKKKGNENLIHKFQIPFNEVLIMIFVLDFILSPTGNKNTNALNVVLK